MIQMFTALAKTGSSNSLWRTISINLNPIKNVQKYFYLPVQVYPSLVLIHISPTGHGGSSAIQKSISKIKKKPCSVATVLSILRGLPKPTSQYGIIYMYKVQAKIPMLH